MKLLKAILSTIGVFGGAILLTWIMSLGVYGVIAGFALIFIAVVFAFYNIWSK